MSVGGLIGILNQSSSSLINSYSSGSVIIENTGTEIGGLLGNILNGPTTTSNYWDTETSGQTSSAGGTGRTTAQMTTQATFSGWDFTGDWNIIADRTYPTLQWQGSFAGVVPTAGSGTSGSPYEIKNAQNLYWITEDTSRLDLYYEQTADIDLTSYNWLPIGTETNPFTGFYNGDDFKITNLISNRAINYVGLFGVMVGTSGQTAELKNVIIERVFIRGEKRVGSLLGKINDNRYVVITRCSVTGTQGRRSVEGKGTTGGLVGANNGFTSGNPANARSKMFECFANVDVKYIGTSSGTDIKIGGLVGCNQRGETYDSFALGAVDGTNGTYYANRVGGLAGCVEQGLIQRSYSAGLVTANASANNVGGFVGNITGTGTGGISASYWDTTTSGWTTSAGTGATGLTTTEMNALTAATTGWNPGIWDFNDGVYPGLIWNDEIVPGVTDSATLIPQLGDGFYENADVGGQGVYSAFQAGGTYATNNDLIINVTHLSSVNNPFGTVEYFPNPAAIGPYWKFEFIDATDILPSGVFLRIQFKQTVAPLQIWYRLEESGSWSVLSSGLYVKLAEAPAAGIEDHTYEVDLDSFFPSRTNFSTIEFTSDNGTETLPVELSSFTAVVTSNMAVNLQWTAETETNMLGYNVFRSENNSLSDAVKANFVIIPAHNTSVARNYSYLDDDVEDGVSYNYWLQSNDIDLTHEFHGPISVLVEPQGEPGGILLPEIVTELVGAYPNPFNPSTAIRFSLDAPAKVSIEVYNILGQHIKTLVSDEQFTKGFHSLVWDGKDSNGRSSSSGIYFYRMQTDQGYRMTKRMAIIK